MKNFDSHRSNSIEFSFGQFLTIIVAATACLFGLIPALIQYRVYRCDDLSVTKVPKDDLPFDSFVHVRKVREVSADQCGVIPPMCLPTTTVTTIQTTTTTTRRSSVSTVSVTRPVITAFPTNPPTTTADPWTSSPRPYNSWYLPPFAKPKSYSLSFSCPECFNVINASSSIFFDGQASITMDVTSTTNFLVLHAKNLNISAVTITPAAPGSPTITSIPEFEMIYLNFTAAAIAPGEVKLDFTYTGEINQKEQIGFYRTASWRSLFIGANFQPIHARRAFPCFDEPHLRADFSLTLNHPTDTYVAVSNMPAQTTDADSTTFELISDAATHGLAWAILPKDGFKSVQKTINAVEVSVWIRSEITVAGDTNLDWTFDLVSKSLAFVDDYFGSANLSMPTKIDLIGVPDLSIDEKASASLGLLIVREEFISVDSTLNTAELIQTTAKVIGEHVLQMWLSKFKWWNEIWFSKSLASFLTYKMIDKEYPTFKMMEQFAVREIVPIMIDDGKPSIWPVSNRNLTNNADIIDSLSPLVYSKGAALLRLLEHIVTDAQFQTSVNAALDSSGSDGILAEFYTSLNSLSLPNTALTPEQFLQAWVTERNYPVVTIDFTPATENSSNTTVVFRQTRHLVSSEFDTTGLDPSYVWPIYMECQFGGTFDGEFLNATGNVEDAQIFIFSEDTFTLDIPDKDYQWIKCNKDFYSYMVTDYLSTEDDIHRLWELFDLILREDFFSSNDRANLLNDAFVLSRTGADVTYDQVIELVRRLYDPVEYYIPWHVFVWHWNSLMGVEEHSRYFENFKKFAQRAILAPNGFEVNNLLAVGSTHTERLIRSMLFELLCRVQNTDALYKTTEWFNQIPSIYFTASTNDTKVPSDYLSTVIYYHLQNVNDINQWDDLWDKLIENNEITAQKRQTFLRALAAAKEIWRLKFYLELAFYNEGSLLENQEVFDIIAAASRNPVGRDIVWNFYRHNYQDLVRQFGTTNRLFNQLINVVTESFENEFYYTQMQKFIADYPSPSKHQQLAFDQILINFEFLINGVAKSLDDAISGGEKTAKKSSSN